MKFLTNISCLTLFVHQTFLLLRSEDIRYNPGPRKSSALKFCHWNFNFIVAHEFTKIISHRSLHKYNPSRPVHLRHLYQNKN